MLETNTILSRAILSIHFVIMESDQVIAQREFCDVLNEMTGSMASVREVVKTLRSKSVTCPHYCRGIMILIYAFQTEEH